MADEEVIKSEFLSPNTLISWDQFQSHSPILLLSDPHEKVKPIWSTPTTVVFPPTNHENLNLYHQVEKDKPLSPAAVVGPSAVKWWLLQFKLPAIVKGLFRLFNFSVFGSTVFMLLLYLRFRHRRRLRLPIKVVDKLIGVIKEKDERIRGLLHQIARMNELLLAKHHGVPMISKVVLS